MAHERCVKVVKENYCAIVIVLNIIYEVTLEPEVLGISKALSKKFTISAMFLLDYVLPQVANLVKPFKRKVGYNDHILRQHYICTIDDALTPAANWVLSLQDMEIKTFQSR